MSESESHSDQGGASEPAAPVGVIIRPLGFVINIPDLRNGDLSNIQQAAPKSSIDAAYKWAVVESLPAAQAVNAVEYLIRGAYATLVSSAGNTPPEATLSDFRRRAIVLGAVRAGAMAAYNLTARDMTITEVTNSGYMFADGRITQRNGGGTAGGKYTIAQSMQAFDALEVESISMLVYLGMAVPALQGASLVSTGHHFLPTTRNIFAGQKRQSFGLIKEQARALIEAMGDVFDDMAFHKACHPISPPFKRRLAKDPGVAARLQMSGHGAAAIRLPALPSDAAIGKTGIALILAAKPTIEGMGHTASVDIGRTLVKDLEKASEGREERDAIVQIQAWATTHSGQFAFCAGIVQHVHESAGSGRNTLLSAFSVKKLMSEHATEVQKGISYARAAASKLRTALESGLFADPMVHV